MDLLSTPSMCSNHGFNVYCHRISDLMNLRTNKIPQLPHPKMSKMARQNANPHRNEFQKVSSKISRGVDGEDIAYRKGTPTLEFHQVTLWLTNGGWVNPKMMPSRAKGNRYSNMHALMLLFLTLPSFFVSFWRDIRSNICSVRGSDHIHYRSGALRNHNVLEI